MAEHLVGKRRRKMSTFSVNCGDQDQEISSQGTEEQNRTFNHIDEKSWNSVDDEEEKVLCEINEDDPEPNQINLDLISLQHETDEPQFKDQAISTVELLSPGGKLESTSVVHDVRPRSTLSARKRAKRPYQHSISSSFKKDRRKISRNSIVLRSIPVLRPSPNRGIPGKFQRSNVIKSSEFLEDPPKPKLLTDEEFKERKAKIMVLHKEQSKRAERRLKEIAKQEERFRKQDEEKKRIEKLNEEIKQTMKKERKKQIEIRLQKRDRQRWKKKQEIRKIDIRSRSVMNSTPMYVKMQKMFEDQYVKPEKEKKLKRLKLIRLDRITPINHSEIKLHNKQYKEKLQKMTEEKMKKRETELSEKLPSTKPDLSNYFSRLVQEMDKKKKEEEARRQINLQRYKKIRNKYSGISLFRKLGKNFSHSPSSARMAKAGASNSESRYFQSVRLAANEIFGRKKRIGNAFLSAFDDLQHKHKKKKDEQIKQILSKIFEQSRNAKSTDEKVTLSWLMKQKTKAFTNRAALAKFKKKSTKKKLKKKKDEDSESSQKENELERVESEQNEDPLKKSHSKVKKRKNSLKLSCGSRDNLDVRDVKTSTSADNIIHKNISMHGNRLCIFGDEDRSSKSGKNEILPKRDETEMSKIKEESIPTQAPTQNHLVVFKEDTEAPKEGEKLMLHEEISLSQALQPKVVNFLKHIIGGEETPIPENQTSSKDSKPPKNKTSKSNRKKVYYRPGYDPKKATKKIKKKRSNKKIKSRQPPSSGPKKPTKRLNPMQISVEKFSDGIDHFNTNFTSSQSRNEFINNKQPNSQQTPIISEKAPVKQDSKPRRVKKNKLFLKRFRHVKKETIRDLLPPISPSVESITPEIQLPPIKNKHKRTETQDLSLKKLDEESYMTKQKTLNADLSVTSKNKIIVLNKKSSKKPSKFFQEAQKASFKSFDKKSPSCAALLEKKKIDRLELKNREQEQNLLDQEKTTTDEKYSTIAKRLTLNDNLVSEIQRKLFLAQELS
ncbi:unnamed protein product [Moneuplotes crassus]|uniref:Uncharacterized protein n=1 Tax=Euplotes crassus TaxID=5936 RepID=A0AAD1UFG1_EUPCR|nr:unnamed protein product [Moneuplotes crassus]